jgi:amino acid transporter
MEESTSGKLAAGERAAPRQAPASATAESGGLANVARLEKDALGLPEILFQNVTNMGPGVSIAYNLPVMALFAGAGLVLAQSFAFAATLLVAVAIIEFAKRIPSTGGFYTYVSRSLGAKVGAFTGLTWQLFAVVLVAEVTIIWSQITEALAKEYLHLTISWIIWETLIIGVVAFLALSGIRRSLRFGIVTGLIETGIFLILAVWLLINPVTTPSLSVFHASTSSFGWAGIMGFGLVYGVLGFTGFEGATPLAEESRNPHRNIPLSIFLTLVVVGVIYIFVAYCVSYGWGVGNLDKFATDPSPYTLMASRLWKPAWVFVYFAITNSAVACCLATTNQAARTFYAMGRIELLPKFFGHVHPVYKTPSHAIVFTTVIGLVLAITTGLLWGTAAAFAVLAGALTFGAIIAYLLVSISLPVFMLKERRDEFSVLKHVVPQVGAVALMGYCFFKVLSPFPAYPYSVAVWGAGAYLLFSAGLVYYLAKTRPDALGKSGLTVLE